MSFFEALKDYRNKMPIARAMQIVTEEIREGYARSVMEVEGDQKNLIGSVHGGALMTLADITAAAAAWSYGWSATTLSCSMQFLNAAREDRRLIAEGSVEKHGKKTQVVRVVISNEAGKKIAVASLIFFNLDQIIEFH